MAKYIEVEKVQEMLENAQIISDGVNCGYCTDDISLDKLPVADVAPVVHAKWIARSFLSSDVFCPECRTLQKTKDSNYKSKYCPHCGAKMDL